MPEDIHVNAVAFQEGENWVAQGIEYDIVAHAPDMPSLADAFTRAVIENMLITQHLGRVALDGIKPAPARFHEMFKNAKWEMRATKHHAGAEVALRFAA